MAKQRSDESDAQTFRAAVRDVTPLAQTPPAAGLARPKPRARLRKAAASETEHIDEAMPLLADSVVQGAGPEAEAPTSESALSFQRAGVRIQTMRSAAPRPLSHRRRTGSPRAHSNGRARPARRFHRAQPRPRMPLRENHPRQGLSLGRARPRAQSGGESLAAPATWTSWRFVSARAIDGGAGAVYVLLRA